MGTKYHGKLKRLRKRVKDIDGFPAVGIKWVRLVLSPLELKKFEKQYKYRKLISTCICPDCKTIHFNPHKFKRYAYWWELEKFFSGENK